MSEPVRYTQNIKCVEPSYLAQNIQSGMVECSIGEWVLHSDYARLKEEVEAYRSASDEVAAAFLSLPTPHNQVARVCEGIESLKADLDYVRKMRTQETLDLQEMSDIVNEVRADNIRLKGIILAQSSDFVRNAIRQEEEPKPEGHNDLAGRAVEHCLKLQTENEQLRHALDLIVEGYEQGSVDGFNLGLMAAKDCK